jgi:2-methylisocitrate lyase-like PEP mutase family enzyme
MDKRIQIEKAKAFLALHHDAKLLVLPNIWDPLGARMLESLGYPAVATASAAVAYSLGYDDGQKIHLDAMLEVAARIVESVEVPVSIDIEAGYAEAPEEVAGNVRQVVRAGAVGINLEDSLHEGWQLRPIAVQQERIRAVRAMAGEEGVPLVINARTDLFLQDGDLPAADRLTETIDRAAAYLEAGADCLYPIGLGNLEMLTTLREATGAPLNVYAAASAPPMKELEAAGISRLSLGPGLIKASLTAMRKVARNLLAYGPYDRFTTGAMSSEEIRRYVREYPMP